MNYFTKLNQLILSRAAKNLGREVVVTSFPKAGRTWLKVMFSQYLFLKYNLTSENDIEIENFHKQNSKIPHIRFVHDDTPFWKKPQELQSSKKSFNKSRLILMIRDPRDMIVSAYFQKSIRHKLKPEADRVRLNKPVYLKSIRDFVYEETGGINTLIQFYNTWWDQKDQTNSFKLIKYENLMENTLQELRSILEFAGIKEVDFEILEKVVLEASFDKMKRLEREKVFSGTQLNPLDVDNPESYKVRRGKIGGYTDYLEQPEIDYLNAQISQKLNPIFGYS